MDKSSMKVEMVMKNPINDSVYFADLELPASEFIIRDAFQKTRVTTSNRSALKISTLSCPILPDLVHMEFESSSVEEFNFFAKRLEQLTEEEQVVLQGVFQQRFESGAYQEGIQMKELINLTYGLDRVMVASGVRNDEQLGQFVIDNNLNEDIASMPDNALYLLDKKQVGKLQRQIDGGVYIKDLYVVTADYEMQEVYDGVHLPETDDMSEQCVFRLEVAGVPESNQEKLPEQSSWICLPMEKQKADCIAKKYRSNSIEDCVYYGFESAIPQIDEELFGDMQAFDQLNELAGRYLSMSEMEQITFKAVLEHEKPEQLADILEITEHLHEYELDYAASDEVDFFLDHLRHHIDTAYDTRWLNNFTFQQNIQAMTDKLGAGITNYGVISARGESLYQLVPYPEEKQELEEEFQDTLEQEEQGMGGMQL